MARWFFLAFILPCLGIAGSFTEIGPGGGGAELCAAIHPANSDILFLGQDVGGILKSTDGGATWRHVNQGLALPKASAGSMGIQDIAFSPANPVVVFASTWGGLFRSSNTGETWKRVIPTGDGFEGWPQDFSCVAVDPAGQVVLAGTGDPFENDKGHGIYRSTNGGLTFSKLKNSGISSNALIGRLLFDPSSSLNPRHVYAATNQGLYRSVNGGLSFNKVNASFTHENIRDIALSRKGTQKRFWLALQTVAGGKGGIYVSENGTDWRRATGNLVLQRPGGPLRVHRLLAHPTNLGIAYVALRDNQWWFGGLFRTVNAGTEWKDVTPDNINLGWNDSWTVLPEGAAIAASSPSRLLVANEAQPLLSNDGGDTWHQVGTRSLGNGTWKGTGVEVTYVYDLKTSSSHAKRIYAGYEDIGLWRSDDGGNSWRNLFWYVNTGKGWSDACSEIHVNPANGNELYAVADSWSNSMRESDAGSILMYSMDGGDVWKKLPVPSPVRGRGAAAVDFSRPESSRTLLFAQHGGTLWRSSDGGRTWKQSRSGIPDTDQKKLFVLCFDPARRDRLYAGTHTDYGTFGTSGGLYRSDDAGISWKKLSRFPHSDVNAIVFAGSPQRMFVGASTYYPNSDLVRGALLASDNGGDTFAGVLQQPYVYSVTSLPGKASTLIAGAGGHYFQAENQYAGLYRSENNGNSWTRMSLLLPHTGILCLLVPAWAAEKIFVGTRGAGITTTMQQW